VQQRLALIEKKVTSVAFFSGVCRLQTLRILELLGGAETVELGEE
jgi:hypothetical protein